jgi:hypothetical protein
MQYRAKTFAMLVVTLALLGGCARLKALHPAAGTAAAPRRTGVAALYPDPAQTPGATDPQVTQANIQTTICMAGWVTKVRPPASYTSALKRKQLAAVGDTVPDRDQKCMAQSANPKCYEEDHLISLELGGAPRAPKNLWPQPYQPVPGAKEKDWVESYLHEQVCAGNMTLLGAQHVLVTDWYAFFVAKHHAPKSVPVAASTGSPTAGASKQAQ